MSGWDHTPQFIYPVTLKIAPLHGVSLLLTSASQRQTLHVVAFKCRGKSAKARVRGSEQILCSEEVWWGQIEHTAADAWISLEVDFRATRFYGALTNSTAHKQALHLRFRIQMFNSATMTYSHQFMIPSHTHNYNMNHQAGGFTGCEVKFQSWRTGSSGMSFLCMCFCRKVRLSPNSRNIQTSDGNRNSFHSFSSPRGEVMRSERFSFPTSRMNFLPSKVMKAPKRDHLKVGNISHGFGSNFQDKGQLIQFWWRSASPSESRHSLKVCALWVLF